MADTRDQAFASLTTSAQNLRDQSRGAGDALKGLVADLARLDAQARQLTALREPDPGLAARLDRLEGVLDVGRVTAHLTEAVARAQVIETPVPHAVIAALLPGDVYAAAIAGIPAPVFFTDPGTRRLELPMPPALASIDAIVTWRFLTAIAASVLGPALVARFRAPLDAHIRTLKPSLDPGADVRLSASQGRLLLRQPGFEPRTGRSRPWHFLTTVICLAQPGHSAAYGSIVRAPGSTGAGVEIPFAPNTALVVLDPAAAHEYAPIPASAPAETERCSYEFPIGPDGESRRRLQ